MKRLELFFLIFISSLSFHGLTSASSVSQNTRAHKKAKLPASVEQALEERDALWQKKLIESQQKTLECVIAAFAKKRKEDEKRMMGEETEDGLYNHDVCWNNEKLIKYLKEQKKEINKQLPSENTGSNKKRKRTKN